MTYEPGPDDQRKHQHPGEGGHDAEVGVAELFRDDSSEQVSGDADLGPDDHWGYDPLDRDRFDQHADRAGVADPDPNGGHEES